MHKIAIVTPNTDTFTNPTMTTLFHMLKERGVDVFLFGRQQQPSCPENLSNVKEIKSVFRLNLFKNPTYFWKHWTSYVNVIRCIRREKITTLLAVDPMGVIVGGRIKRLLGKKIYLSYLSFEIFFKEELTGHYLLLKEKEIYYSATIDSLLIQDEKRRSLLISENNIKLSPKQIALVPVSPMKIEVQEKPDLHAELNIPVDKKLAVYSGSVGEWCGTKAIIEAFDKGYWDDNYWLVFHTRKPIDKENEFYADLMRLDNDVTIPFSMHPHPFDGFEELAVFLSGFDLALALYYPNHDNPYYGKNMQEIGLSSGKFSMYMMLGLPTIVTACAIYNELIQKYSFGAVITDIHQIKNVLLNTDFSKWSAFELFDSQFEPKNRMKLFLEIIEKIH